jgi:hypothetical protein
MAHRPITAQTETATLPTSTESPFRLVRAVERATGIEPAEPAWKTALDLQASSSAPHFATSANRVMQRS